MIALFFIIALLRAFGFRDVLERADCTYRHAVFIKNGRKRKAQPKAVSVRDSVFYF